MSIWAKTAEQLEGQAYRLSSEIGQLYEEIRREERKQEERRLLERRRQEYQEAYSTFAFLLSRDTKEARHVLEGLYTRFPELLRQDGRLESDVRRLLSTETSEFEARLRSRLGLWS